MNFLIGILDAPTETVLDVAAALATCTLLEGLFLLLSTKIDEADKNPESVLCMDEDSLLREILTTWIPTVLCAARGVCVLFISLHFSIFGKGEINESLRCATYLSTLTFIVVAVYLVFRLAQAFVDSVLENLNSHK